MGVKGKGGEAITNAVFNLNEVHKEEVFSKIWRELYVIEHCAGSNDKG